MNTGTCFRVRVSRNCTSVVRSAPWSWKRFFARLPPIIIAVIPPSSFLRGVEHHDLAHCDALWRGRQPLHLTKSELEGRCSCRRALKARARLLRTPGLARRFRQAARSFGSLAGLQAAMVIVNGARTLSRPR